MPRPRWIPALAVLLALVLATVAPSPAAAQLEPLAFDRGALAWSITRLSSGERQRLALLRVLAHDPRALLLDEPTANLDAESTTRVENLIADYRERHDAPVLWVTHGPEQARRVANRHFRVTPSGLIEEPLA